MTLPWGPRLNLSSSPPSIDIPNPGPVGIIKLPCDGEADADSRSLSNSGVVPKPWAKVCSLKLAHKCALVVTPTPDSRDEVTTTPFPKSCANCISLSEGWIPPSRPALMTIMSAFSATFKIDSIERFAKASSTAIGTETDCFSLCISSKQVGVTGSSTYSMLYEDSLFRRLMDSLMFQVWLASILILTSLGIASLTPDNRASSCFIVPCPTFSFIVSKPASNARLASYAACLAEAEAMRAFTGNAGILLIVSWLILRPSNLPNKSATAVSTPNLIVEGISELLAKSTLEKGNCWFNKFAENFSRYLPALVISLRLPGPIGEASPTPVVPSLARKKINIPYRTIALPCAVEYGLLNGIPNPRQETCSIFIKSPNIGGIAWKDL